MKIPFLIKQYISNDLEQSTFSKFFWYYPLPSDDMLTNTNSGIGMFIEVLSGDLDFSLYEYITKRFWEVFRINFYKRTFESALQRAIFTFLQLLQEAGVQEGLDMNLCFFSATKENDKDYKFKLVRFGDLDIVLIRKQEYANLIEMAPNNTDFRKMEYLEIDLEPDDVILIGNHSLIINAIETNMIDISNYESVLTVLEEFKANLYGAQKILFLGVIEDIKSSTADKKAAIQLKLLEYKDKMMHYIKVIAEKVKQSQVSKKLMNLAVKISTKVKRLLKKRPKRYRNVQTTTPSITTQQGKVENTIENSSVSIDNINDELSTSEVKRVSQNAVKPRYVDPLTEFKRRRSITYKLLVKFKEYLGGINLGKLGVGVKKRAGKNLKISNSLGIKRRNYVQFIPLGGMLLVVLFVVYLSIYIKNIKNDKKLLKDVDSKVAELDTFYKENITSLDGSDPEHLLDLCLQKVDDVERYLQDADQKLKLKTNKQKLQNTATKVVDIDKDCTDRFNTIYHIIEVDHPTLLTDFSVELGADSNPVDIYIKSGVLEILDKGKNAIYEVNIENGNLLKLEDPNNLLSDPKTIASSDKRLFICDKDNGILYYDAEDKKFKQITGTDAQSVGGECNILGAYARNAYFLTDQGDILYKVLFSNDSYALPSKYIQKLKGVRDIAIDGNIYLLEKDGDTIDIKKYFAGKYDVSFKLSPETKETIGDADYIYTNPSNEFPIYVYSRDENTIFVVEKPNADRHPGYGVIVKRYKLGDKFDEVKGFVVYHSPNNNKELKIYVLSGSTIWVIPIT